MAQYGKTYKTREQNTQIFGKKSEYNLDNLFDIEHTNAFD